MPDIYHLKIKKEFAADLIEDLIKADAVENLGIMPADLPQWQKDALDTELQSIVENPGKTIPWESVKGQFKQP